MNKKVAFGTVPGTGSAAPASLDDLVRSRSEAPAEPAAPEKPAEPTRRVSVDLPVTLHTKLKLHCVQSGVLMADYVRDLIAAQFKEP